MKRNTILFLLIAIPFIGINARTNVIINVLDKTKGMTNLSFQDWPAIRTSGFVEIKYIKEMQVTSDSTGIFVIETSGQPNILVASLFKEREQKQILITPGDTITAVIDFRGKNKDRFDVVFYGKHEENYNAYYNLNKEFDRNKIMKMAESVKSLEKYIQIIDSAYASNTKKINATLKPSILRDLMLNEEKTQIFLYLDYRKRVAGDKLTTSNFLSIKKRYFPDKKTVCKNPIYLKSVKYSNGMELLKSFLCEDIKMGNQLIAETDTIKKYFAGELKKYLLVMNFGRSAYLYKKDKELNGADIDNWYHDYFGKFKDDIFNKYLQYAYERYKILNKPFPENILKAKIIQLSDSTVYTISDFLKKYKGMQLVLDNWATWCGPCIFEMNKGKENVQKLKDIGNTFVYISIDEISDFNRAKEKAKELGIIDDAYLIHGGYKSEYAKYLNIVSIPRFVMIDTEGNVKDLQMPFPSNISNFFDYKK